MRASSLFLAPILLLGATGCERSSILFGADDPAGVTGARATGQYPDIQAVPPRAAQQFDEGTQSAIASELRTEAREARQKAPVVGG